MKKIMTFFAMVVIASLAMAQSETTRMIHGAVVDKNGNPLPGAVVSATDGAETALVNADGTFELEIPIWLRSVTASYAGYKNKKMKPKFDKDMIFRLKKDNKRFGFLNALGGAVLFDGCSAASLGLMGGMLANVGFYAKAGLMFGGDYTYDAGGFVIGGVTKRIYKNLYAYLGVGYGSVLFYGQFFSYNYPYNGTGYWYNDDGYYDGMAFDGGLIFKIGRHFDITAGYTHTADFEGYWNCIPNLSLGYVF